MDLRLGGRRNANKGNNTPGSSEIVEHLQEGTEVTENKKLSSLFALFPPVPLWLVCCWVGELVAGDLGEGREFVFLYFAYGHDVEGFPAEDDEPVGEQAAMAAPGEDFGAHDRGADLFGHD